MEWAPAVSLEGKAGEGIGDACNGGGVGATVGEFAGSGATICEADGDGNFEGRTDPGAEMRARPILLIFAEVSILL